MALIHKELKTERFLKAKTHMNRLLILFLIFISFKAKAQSSALQLADNLYANGNYSKAIAKYKSYPNQDKVYAKIAKAYIAIGNYGEAVINYKKSVEANPNNALLKYEYAKILYVTKKFKEASQLFNDLIYIDSTNPNYHYQSGLALQKLNDSTALDEFRTTFDLDNTHQKAIRKIAVHFLKKRKPKVVDYYVDTGLKTYPNNVELISLKAQNFYWKEDYFNAIKWFKKLLALGESTEFIHEKLSLSYGHEFNYKKAIEHRKIVLKFNPYDATSKYVIGQYYMKLKDYENAEKFIKQYLLVSDIALDAEYEKLGVIYNYQKKYKEAIEAFQKALKENPSSISTQFYLVRSKDEYYADVDSKIKLYEDFKKKYPSNPFIMLADRRLEELRKEKFLEKE